MNPWLDDCPHTFKTSVDYRVRETQHECQQCGHVETATLHAVSSGALPKDLWLAVGGKAA